MARAVLVAIVAAAVVACGTPATPAKAGPDVAAPGPAPVAPDAGVDAVLAVAVAPAPICDGVDQRLYGTTCCDVTRADDNRKFPGMTFLSCHGPQIGKPCGKKRDCDLACFCDDHDQPRDPRSDGSGPPDGTMGVTGACGGRFQIGVWMCQIDEKGAVTHVIVD